MSNLNISQNIMNGQNPPTQVQWKYVNTLLWFFLKLVFFKTCAHSIYLYLLCFNQMFEILIIQNTATNFNFQLKDIKVN